MDGDGETFIHIYTYKNKRKMNTDFAFMQSNAKYERKERQDGCDKRRFILTKIIHCIIVDTRCSYKSAHYRRVKLKKLEYSNWLDSYLSSVIG